MNEPEIVNEPEGKARALRELASFFFRLGLTAFGGPAAHIAMMEQEAVRRRDWLSHEAFLDLLGATNLMGVRRASPKAGAPALLRGALGTC